MADDGDIRLSEIGQVALMVHDLEKATEFYRDVLRLPFLFSVPGMAFFQCGNIRLMLGTAEASKRIQSSSIVYYRVDEIEGAFETLKGRGVEFKQEPVLAHKAEGYELWLAFFPDPDGNMLALMCEKQSS